VVAVALDGPDRTGHGVDPGRSRGHDRRRAGERLTDPASGLHLTETESYWLGAAAGAALTLLLLNPTLFAENLGWWLAFGLGAVLGVGILLVRRNVPESPRWLFTHGRAKEADRLVQDIEQQVSAQTGMELETVHDTIDIHERKSTGFGVVGRRTMIATTYLDSGVLLVVTAVLFQQNLLSAWTLTIAWSLVFFLASAGSSAAVAASSSC
jgi:hypothetical protein